jgi:hypothetical protein
VLKALCGNGYVEIVSVMVIVCAITDYINTRTRTYVDADIPDWVGEEVSDGAIDIE